RLRGDPSPGVRGRGLLRRDHPDRDRRVVVGDGHGRLDGEGAVPRAPSRASGGSSLTSGVARGGDESRVAVTPPGSLTRRLVDSRGRPPTLAPVPTLLP